MTISLAHRGRVTDAPDGHLITLSRHGLGQARAVLFERHRIAAVTAARSLTRSRAGADGLVIDGFATVFSRLQQGGGPDLAFRPYLVSTIGRRFHVAQRRRGEGVPVAETADIADTVNLLLLERADLAGDRLLVLAAFARLPERWQMVLWHVDVERQSPAEVAPLVGLSPNAVAALACRAREGLHLEFLTAQLHVVTDESCYECRRHLATYLRQRSPEHERRSVARHLDRCLACAALLPQLRQIGSDLRSSIVPALLGASATTYVCGGLASRRGPFGWTLQPRRRGADGGAAAIASIRHANGVN